MTVKNQELYNVIEKLPEELSVKVLDYIEYLMFSNANNNAPEELIVKKYRRFERKIRGRKKKILRVEMYAHLKKLI